MAKLETRIIAHLKKLSWAQLEDVATMVADLYRNVSDEEYTANLAVLIDEFQEVKSL